MKKGFMTKVFMLLLIASLIFIAACGGGSNNNTSGNNTPANTGGGDTPPASSSGEDVNLSIMWWGPDARHEATLAALDIYTEQNPNVSWTPEYISWDAFWAKLPTLAASNTMTDVLQMDAAYIQEYVARGTLADLSHIDLDGLVDPNIVENLKIDGKLYGIPLSHNAQGFAYVKSAFEEYGISEPQQGWNWDDFFDFVVEAHEKLPADIYPISYTTTWDGYQYYQTAMGKGPLMEDEGATFNLDRDTFLEYFAKMEEFRTAGMLPPADLQASFLENDPQADPLASGKVLMTSKSVGSVSALELLMPGQIAVVNKPVGPTGKGGWAQSTIFLSVSEDSQHKEQAFDFVKWFIEDQEAGKALGLTRGIPINDAIFEMLEPDLEQKDIIGKELSDAAIPYALPFYAAPAGYSEFIDFFENQMEAVMFGQASIEEAYNNINDLGESIAASR